MIEFGFMVKKLNKKVPYVLSGLFNYLYENIYSNNFIRFLKYMQKPIFIFKNNALA